MVRDQYPEHPIGYFMQGVASWMMTRGSQGVGASEDSLLAGMKRSTEISKEYVNEYPDDAYGWLIYGMSLGAQARVDLARSRWLAAAVHGLRGIRRVQKAEDLNPDLPDLKLAMGAFHYYVGMSGGLLKTAAGLVGLRGTKEEGLEELTYAVENGIYGTPQAQDILVYIYGYLENRVPEALALAEEMTATYYNNPYYRVMEADLYIASGNLPAAEETVDAIPPMLIGIAPFYLVEYQNKMLYLRGLLHYHDANYEEAISSLNQYLEQNVEEYDFHATNTRLHLGKSYWQLGRESQARQYLQEVAESDISTRMKAEAQRLLEET